MLRKCHGEIEVFLVHPGGPFWAKKDEGAWSIPKGEFSEEENPLEAAKREFQEETGFHIDSEFQPLNSLKQSGGKIVYAWLVEGNVDDTVVKSNAFSIEWPPGSDSVKEFPEVDRAGWFFINVARQKIVKGQAAFLDQLEHLR